MILGQCSFLYQLDHLGQENYKPNPILEKALDVLFLLHADHELNASSTTVLQTGSSLVDPYSAIAAGCASLYGPLHGACHDDPTCLSERLHYAYEHASSVLGYGEESLTRLCYKQVAPTKL